MTTLASLRILLGLDAGGVKGAASAVRGDLKGVQAEARATSDTLNQIGKGVVAGFGIGAGISAFQVTQRAVRGTVDAINDAVKAAREEDVGIARLTTTLRENVTAWDGDIASIEKTVKSRTALAFSDDVLRDSLGSLVTATHDVQKALDDQAIAIDLARFKNISLAETTDQLVKIEAGSFRSLRNLGIETAGVTNATQALAAVRAAVAGQSTAFLETDAAKAEKAKVALDELAESFGHLASGPLAEASDALANFFNILSGVGDKFKTQGENLAEQAAGFVQTATLAQLQAVRDGVQKQLEAADNPLALAAGAQPAIREVLAQLDAAIEQYASHGAKDAQLANENLRTSFYDAQSAAGDLTGGLDEAGRAALALTIYLGSSADATKAQKDAAQDAMAQFKLLGTVFDGFNGVVVVGSAHMGTYSADLDNTALRAAALKANVDTLGGSLNALPTNIDIDINVTQRLNAAQFAPKTGPSADIGVAGRGLPGFEDQGRDEELFVAQQKQHIADVAAARTKAEQDAAKAAREAEQAREKAARDAAAAERKYASEMHDALNEAYRSVGEAAKRYFSDVHTARLKDIDEARKAADDLIEQQKRANLQPVTEAEATLRAIQQQRELGQLQSQLAAAQTPEDKLRAQQALNDFEARARIDTLRANADAANAKLDQDKAAQDDAFAQQKAAEDQRYQDQLRAFEADEKALKKHLDNATGHWQAYFREIATLAKKYGVSDLVGVYPNPATATGRKAEAAASVTAATPDYPARRPNDVSNVRMDTMAERPIVVYIYLDGEDITSKVDIRQGTRQSIVTSGGIAR